jgi:germination protein M
VRIPRRLVTLIVLVLLLGGGLFIWEEFLHKRGEVEETDLTEHFDEQGMRSVTLYFGNRRAEALVSERRIITASLHRDDEVESVVEELLRGPVGTDAVRTWPDGTKLRDVFYDDDLHLLYLDFNSALVSGDTGGSAMETLTLGALLRTIAIDFPEVEMVQILVDGLEVETLAGHIDCTKPFRPHEWL